MNQDASQSTHGSYLHSLTRHTLQNMLETDIWLIILQGITSGLWREGEGETG